MEVSPPHPSPLQQLAHPAARAAGVRLYCKRDDLLALHPGSPLQGNKLRKLQPLLAGLDADKLPTVVSFGGAYSNHLAALAAASAHYGFATRFYVRGEPVDNPTLRYVRSRGSTLRFISRTDYRRRHEADFIASLLEAGRDVLVPEGGTTPEALPYAGQAYTETCVQLGGSPPDYFCLSAGTGGTAAGIVAAAQATATHIEVYPALKGDWMAAQIGAFTTAGSVDLDLSGLHVVTDYHYGGYAKFPDHWHIGYRPGAVAMYAELGEPGLPPLEPVYTAKLFSGVLDRIRRGVYPQGATVVILHTGGVY
ncbi:L-cysteate sulfo-lyase [Neolewinella maritima]|uniref:L-cysteate sulfo-lyase n=1 Tax=Neolewinella maritima TaxID=1383882 RepID=A0ABM9AXX9_9BACT|nr:pyridoxal-phosphate dependent enzyme [Neolewinella maritima]CAH0999152.1 L-cysteate sulfo-lyase [Neolewinella maritima]